MRALLGALAMVMVPFAAFAGTDIGAVCYKDCEAQTRSNPNTRLAWRAPPTRPMPRSTGL